MRRRDFLATAGSPALLRGQTPGFVTSDIARLRRVLVHAPGEETRQGLGLGYGPIRLLSSGIDERAAAEHKALVDILRRAGAEVLFFKDSLDAAVKSARSAGVLETWLRGWAPQLAPLAAKVDASVLLGAAAEWLYRNDDDGRFAPLSDPAGSLYWTRDCAFMTPRGVVIGRFSNEARTVESILARFLYEWSPALKKYPIVFDAAEHDVSLEGGDAMVADEKTLLVGVGNRTSEAAAPKLARALNMDVVAVRLPSGARSPLQNMFLHLDTVCTLVGTKTALTLPWFFDKSESGRDPLSHMLRGMAAKPKAKEHNLESHLPALARLGSVEVFLAGIGKKDEAVGDIKLADYLRARGYKIVLVGGDPPAAGRERHAAEVVLKELRRQASNVVAVAPGKVVAYQGNPFTAKALASAGIEVIAFNGTELARQNGGPHCLTQPLERG
jgi:arginine deiminase